MASVANCFSFVSSFCVVVFVIVLLCVLLCLRVALVVANLSHFYFDFALIFRTAWGYIFMLPPPVTPCDPLCDPVHPVICPLSPVQACCVFNAKCRVVFVVSIVLLSQWVCQKYVGAVKC